MYWLQPNLHTILSIYYKSTFTAEFTAVKSACTKENDSSGFTKEKNAFTAEKKPHLLQTNLHLQQTNLHLVLFGLYSKILKAIIFISQIQLDVSDWNRVI